jgi:hypothetical protein
LRTDLLEERFKVVDASVFPDFANYSHQFHSRNGRENNKGDKKDHKETYRIKNNVSIIIIPIGRKKLNWRERNNIPL